VLTTAEDGRVELPIPVWEALFDAVKASARSRRSRDVSGPPRNGAYWSQGEVSELITAFNAGTSVAAIALDHQRTTSGVESKLASLGLIERHERLYAPPPEPSPHDNGPYDRRRG
jgi:hypothetical protein